MTRGTPTPEPSAQAPAHAGRSGQGVPNRRAPMLRAWIPALAWGALIWALGGDGFSQPETSRILDPLIAWLFPDLPETTRAALVAGVRKLAHPVEYGVLALLSLRGVRLTYTGAQTRGVGLALLPALALAAADELRQSLSAVRTGAALDVGLDLAGAALALGTLVLLERACGARLVGRNARRISASPDAPV